MIYFLIIAEIKKNKRDIKILLYSESNTLNIITGVGIERWLGIRPAPVRRTPALKFFNLNKEAERDRNFKVFLDLWLSGSSRKRILA